MTKVIKQSLYSATDVAKIVGKAPGYMSLLFRKGEFKTVPGERKNQRCLSRSELEKYLKKLNIKARFVDREPPPSVFKFKTYRKYLKKYFKITRVPLEKAAKNAGIAIGMLHGVIHGAREPSIQLLFRLGESFGMSDSELRYLMYLWVNNRIKNKRVLHVLFPELSRQVSG